jgi:PAS domain S-box-containing protein
VGLDGSRQQNSPDPPPARAIDVGTLVDRSPTSVLVLDADSLCVIHANAAARLVFDLALDVGDTHLSDIVASFPAGRTQGLLRRLREGLVDHVVLETRTRTPAGRSTPIEIRLSYDPDPSPHYLALVLELSERSTPDELAVRRERVRDALTEILRVITGIDDRDELYRAACRIAVERGGFRMAWIGLVDKTTSEIRPVASAGFVEGYLDSLHLSVRGDPRGPGMTATAIETLQPVAIADPHTDPMFRTLKPEVQKRGYESAVSLPLVVEGEAIGALTVYATVLNAFGVIEVELLQRLADDISFKLEVIGREETRRAAEAERDRLAAVVEQAGESVVITDRDGRIVYTNAAFARITGYGAQEVIGRRQDFLRAESQSPETEEAIGQALLEGRSWTGSSRDRRKDGIERDMDLVISPRRDGAGNAVGRIIIGRDVSRERSLEAQLTQSQKLEAIGRLAGGVAHDFNNLLTAISGYAEILRSQFEADDPRAEDVLEIQRAATRATQLTAQLLAFGRRQILRPRPLDPQSILAGITPMLRRLIGEDVEVVTMARPGLGAVMADPGQLDQVLVNLALNARDAMPTGGRLEIEVDEIELDNSFVETHVGAHVGRHVVFRVGDTGIGMDPDVRAHAFEPFYTTKGPGKGTGLGLSTVFGIMEQSNGYVEVDSEPGRGTTFRLYLPAALAAADAPSRTDPAAAMPGVGTILVVEDEQPVRALACRILEKAGYVVLAAATGEQALDVEAWHEGPIDLLFTDVILPGMSGRELAEVVTARRPGMPVLYASGYNQEIAIARGVLGPGISYLPKPYSGEQVLRRIREHVKPAVDVTEG